MTVAVVGGVPFTVSRLDHAVKTILAMASGQEKAVPVRLANVYSVVVANSDPAYSRLLLHDGPNYPDGAPVVACMKLLSGRFEAQRVRGPSFFRRTVELGLDKGTRHFFLGTTEETLARLIRRLKASHPGIQVAGSYAPSFLPYGDDLVQECVQAISGKNIDIVWVGMGSPKQDFIAAKVVSEFGIPAAGVGAAFDFVAGTVREAPRWVQTIGMEWAFRLLADPKRLWKRYIFGNTKFLWLIAKTAFLQVGRKLLLTLTPHIRNSESR